MFHSLLKSKKAAKYKDFFNGHIDTRSKIGSVLLRKRKRMRVELEAVFLYHRVRLRLPCIVVFFIVCIGRTSCNTCKLSFEEGILAVFITHFTTNYRCHEYLPAFKNQVKQNITKTFVL